jgi:hypothetical protein
MLYKMSSPQAAQTGQGTYVMPRMRMAMGCLSPVTAGSLPRGARESRNALGPLVVVRGRFRCQAGAAAGSATGAIAGMARGARRTLVPAQVYADRTPR